MRFYRGDYAGGRRTISRGEAVNTVRRKGMKCHTFKIPECRKNIVQVVDC